MGSSPKHDQKQDLRETVTGTQQASHWTTAFLEYPVLRMPSLSGTKNSELTALTTPLSSTQVQSETQSCCRWRANWGATGRAWRSGLSCRRRRSPSCRRSPTRRWPHSACCGQYSRSHRRARTCDAQVLSAIAFRTTVPFSLALLFILSDELRSHFEGFCATNQVSSAWYADRSLSVAGRGGMRTRTRSGSRTWRPTL